MLVKGPRTHAVDLAAHPRPGLSSAVATRNLEPVHRNQIRLDRGRAEVIDRHGSVPVDRDARGAIGRTSGPEQDGLGEIGVIAHGLELQEVLVEASVSA